MSFETSEQVPGPFIESHHSFVSSLIPEDVTTRLDLGYKFQGRSEDGNIFPATEKKVLSISGNLLVDKEPPVE